MSAIVISGVERFIAMLQGLENIGISKIHFYNSRSKGTMADKNDEFFAKLGLTF